MKVLLLRNKSYSHQGYLNMQQAQLPIFHKAYFLVSFGLFIVQKSCFFMLFSVRLTQSSWLCLAASEVKAGHDVRIGRKADICVSFKYFTHMNKRKMHPQSVERKLLKLFLK